MVNPYASPIDGRSMRAAPLVRQASISGNAVTVAVVVALAAGGWLVTNSATGVVWGMGIYFAYAWLTRLLIPRDHRRGIRLVRQGRYEEAIQAFENSLSFFTRHSWIDRLRAITMLSPSAMSYREMALCNTAFCYSQIGQGAKSKAIYQSVLAEYPDNLLAPASLRMLETGERMAVGNDSSGGGIARQPQS
jgi:tetratricopeptide (TPR) repeat protein